MKKKYIIIITIIAIIVAIVASVTTIYKYVVAPKFIEPIVEDVSEYLKDDSVLRTLYREATELYDDGVMDDGTYTDFVRAYKEHFRDDEEYAREILEQKETSSERDGESTTLKTKYASNKVGVEVIKVNDDDNEGRAEMKYSSERTSDRLQSEDFVQAEKIIEEAEGRVTPTPAPSIEETAYQKLKSHMKADEYSTFAKIMAKLQVGELKKYISDKEGLKTYLHSKLTDEEYKEIVNLGYKYVYVFLDN